MNKLIFILMIFAWVLFSCAQQEIQSTNTQPSVATLEQTATPMPISSPTQKPIPFFELYSPDPIVPNGEDGAWDDRFTDPGAVVFHDGIFHMFRNGFRAFPATSQVGYVTSADGVTWEEQNNGEPIFKSEEVAYAKIAIYASSVIVDDDGTWVLYFYTWDSSSFPGSSVIGRATATDPNGAWVADVEPVLLLGASGEWDAQQVLAPHVIKNDDGYIMYYSGTNKAGKQQIGMATSSDGIQWIKYNDPTTTEAPYLESDPVFIPDVSGTWDAGWVHQPRVFQTADRWIMVYRATKTANGEKIAIGLATSRDGISWERSPLNPIFMPRDIPKAGYLWFHNALLVNDMLYLFLEGDINQSTQIYLAIHKGDLP